MENVPKKVQKKCKEKVQNKSSEKMLGKKTGHNTLFKYSKHFRKMTKAKKKLPKIKVQRNIYLLPLFPHRHRQNDLLYLKLVHFFWVRRAFRPQNHKFLGRGEIGMVSDQDGAELDHGPI